MRTRLLISIIVLAALTASGSYAQNKPTYKIFALAQPDAYGWRIVKEKGKCGIIDEKGNIVVPIVYDDMELKGFGGGDHVVVKSNGKWGVVNRRGEEVFAPIHDGIIAIDDDTAFVLRDGKWGAIDTKGEIRCPFIYTNIRVLSYGLYGFGRDGKWGFMDSTLAEISPPAYDYLGISYNRYGNIQVVRDKKYGIADNLGREKVPPIYEPYVMAVVWDDLLLVMSRMKPKVGLMDKQGKMITPFKYNFLEAYFPNGTAIVSNTEYKGNFWDAMAQTGTTTTYGYDYGYDSQGNYGYGYGKKTELVNTDLASIRTREVKSEGLIDRTGREIIPVKEGQHIRRHDDGTFELYTARKTKGFGTEYIPTGKFYDSNGNAVRK